MDLSTLLTNELTGGLLGFAGNIVTFGLSYFKNKQDHKFKMEEEKLAMDKLSLQGQLDAAKTSGEIALTQEKSVGEAFLESQKSETSLSSVATYIWAGTVRVLVRPIVTFYLVAVSTLLYFFPPATTAQEDIASGLLIMTNAVVFWWFGQRQIEKHAIVFGNNVAKGKVTSNTERK